MPVDLAPLAQSNRLLFAIPLQPLQGQRFQPTGFPNLGAATYQTPQGQCLLVESAQSMANRLEATCWDTASNAPVAALAGISHVTVTRKGKFLTDSMLEAHRVNSPYLLKGKDKKFDALLKNALGEPDVGSLLRPRLAEVLFRLDLGSLLHGVFLSQSDIYGGRARLQRSLSAFIEAVGVQVAPSGGVKNDHVHPSKVEGDSENRFGNIPFARDEYTAERITLYANLDLAQLRGYALGDDATRLLVLLALYKLRRLLDGDLRLRTACDLEPVARDQVAASAPKGFALPDRETLEADLRDTIGRCQERMQHTTVTFEDVLKKSKETETAGNVDPDENDDAGD